MIAGGTAEPGAFALAAVEASHRAEWEAMFTAYAEYHRSPLTAEMRDRVWDWLVDRRHDLRALVALDPTMVGIGFVHYRPFVRPLAANVGGFIDDIFVVSAWRGSGLAEAMVEAVVAEGREAGWSVVRWITDEDNHRAQSFYDRIAKRGAWITYQIPLV